MWLVVVALLRFVETRKGSEFMVFCNVDKQMIPEWLDVRAVQRLCSQLAGIGSLWLVSVEETEH